jgi:hypothetical protein
MITFHDFKTLGVIFSKSDTQVMIPTEWKYVRRRRKMMINILTAVPLSYNER